MAERVHPSDSPVRSEGSSQFPGRNGSAELPKKPTPPPGTYVVQIPKDQIYRIPPPENSHRFQYLSRRKTKGNRCRCCICSFLAALLILVVLAGISAAVLYLVFKPEALKYSVDVVTISGFNLTSKSTISPTFDVIVRSRNPNGKIGIYYEDGSAVDVSYNGVDLCQGAWPATYQPPKNVTLLKTALTGTTIHLTKADRKTMLNQEKNRKVPFKLKIEAPVKVKIGSVKTWTITVKVNCDLTVNKLTTESKVVERKCSHAVDLW